MTVQRAPEVVETVLESEVQTLIHRPSKKVAIDLEEFGKMTGH